MSPPTTPEELETSPGGRICLTGGTGFVGSAIRQAIGNRPIRLIVRDASNAQSAAAPGVEIVEGDVTKPESMLGKFDGCDTVIHLVGIIAEENGVTFDGVIRGGTANVVAEAQRAGARRFVHMSAMGARDDPAFPYLKAKWDSEQIVRGSGMEWTIFRPSVIFGPGDGFISVLANLVKKTPIVPIAGSGQNRFQPIAANDVASAFVNALDDQSTRGETYEIGGPDILTYEAMIDVIAGRLEKKARKAHLPVGLVKTVVTISKPLPAALRPPVTSEQLRMLAIDNCTNDSATARLIGRQPISLHDGIDYILG